MNKVYKITSDFLRSSLVNKMPKVEGWIQSGILLERNIKHVGIETEGLGQTIVEQDI